VILTVPSDDGSKYPSLGGQVVEWMHDNLVFGPGDLRGQPLRLDPEQQGFIWRFYELFPKNHPHAGRRRFRRCALSLPKGLRKTELAACVAAAELHPDAPVRFNGWSGKGLATGKGVTDPFVVLVAYTEEQSDELAYGALKAILEESPIGRDFDIGLERIMRKGGDGKAVSLAGSPNARDGARTTFAVYDETHWWTLPRLKQAHQTMGANMSKRPLAEPWSLETTTAPEPGGGSVAEATMEYARAVSAGTVRDADLFFYHRQASDTHDITTIEGARAAVIEASGSAASWRDIDGIVAIWSDPTQDRTYWERVWCNRLVQSSGQAFDAEAWKALAHPETKVKPKSQIVIGFDGSVYHDATAIVATDIPSGYQWLAGLWERPFGRDEWEVPQGEVDAVVRSLFDRYTVWRMYADPFRWRDWIAAWSGAFGKERVIEWPTNRQRPMAMAVAEFDGAIRQRLISHDGSPDYARHIGNARKDETIRMVDEQGKPLWMIRKERPDSPHKIDAAMAGILSWKARTDAISAGVTKEAEYAMYIFGGGR
jgi:hypothetical protein